MFEDLTAAIKCLGAAEWELASGEELRDAVVELARLRSMLDAVETRVAGTFDAMRAWAPSGAQSARAWTAAETREPRADCGARLRLARKLRWAPKTADAFAAGEITAAHARRIVGCLNRRTASAFARDEDRLVEWARRLPFEAWCRKLDEWRLHVDPDGCDDDEMARRERRGVHLDETLDGEHHGTMRFDKTSGVIVKNELDRLADELFRRDWAEAKARLGRDPKPDELARTPQQRRADAMVNMAMRSAAMPPGSRAPRPLFTVLLGTDALNGICRLEGGPTIPHSSLMPWLRAAEWERVLFDGTPSRVIDVSRKRTFTGALRRLIEVRDQECFHRHCDTPAPHCQVDHVQPYAAGGVTSQDNGRLACGFHNRARNTREPPDDDH